MWTSEKITCVLGTAEGVCISRSAVCVRLYGETGQTCWTEMTSFSIVSLTQSHGISSHLQGLLWICNGRSGPLTADYSISSKRACDITLLWYSSLWFWNALAKSPTTLDHSSRHLRFKPVPVHSSLESVVLSLSNRWQSESHFKSLLFTQDEWFWCLL